MKTTNKQTHRASTHHDVTRREREDRFRTLINRYVASAGNTDFRDLIKEMSFFETISDSVREHTLAR